MQEIKVVCFRVADCTYALDIMRVREIVHPLAVTPLPDAPPYVMGVINLRGVVIPLVDVRSRFGLPPCRAAQTSRYIIVRCAGRSVGMVVDAVTEVVALAVGDLRAPPTVIAVPGYRFLIGVCLVRDALMLLLNPDRVLACSFAADIQPTSAGVV